VNASNAQTVACAKRIARYLGMADSTYRKTLVKLREHIRIIENSLREKDYTFDYSKQPSKAMFKYRQAFIRNDNERYMEFLNKVEKGEAKLNAKTLMPYDVIAPIVNWETFDKFWYDKMAKVNIDPDMRRSINASWNALEDFADGRNALAVIDGSGSMYWDYGSGMMPAIVAQSLGIYFAEHSRGRFRNCFITFSETPRFVKIRGNDIAEKVRYCQSFDECANTDLFAVYRLILRAALKYSLPQEELPELIYIISDMEFDTATRGSEDEATVHEKAKKLYETHGYKLPQVVYWNVCSRNEQVPVTMSEAGTALVSGASPILFRQMMEMDITPFTMMEKILGSERYAPVAA
jgi:hypothetical protein